MTISVDHTTPEFDPTLYLVPLPDPDFEAAWGEWAEKTYDPDR